MSEVQSTPQASIGLRLAASAVAVLAAVLVIGLLANGTPLAPRRALLGAWPMAEGALLHAIMLLVGTWWRTPPPAAQRTLQALMLVGGMLLVAGGTDAAASHVRRTSYGDVFDVYAVAAGVLVALQGAFGVLLVWSRRAMPYDRRPKRRHSPWSRRDDS